MARARRIRPAIQVAVGAAALSVGIAMALLSVLSYAEGDDLGPPRLRPSSALGAPPDEQPSRALSDPVAPAYFSLFALSAGAWALGSGLRSGRHGGRWLRRTRLRSVGTAWLVPGLAGLVGGCAQLVSGSVLVGAVAAGVGAAAGTVAAVLAMRSRRRVERAAAT